MAILVDLSQVSVAGIAMEMARGENFEKDLAIHFILNSVRSLNKKYGPDYGEMILCCDGRRSWRRDYFEPYKWRRRQAKTVLDETEKWNHIFEAKDEVTQALIDHFPFKVVQVSGAEGDDVIGRYIQRHYGYAGQPIGNRKPTLIVSGDKDFQQLQVSDRVVQYSPTLKKRIPCKDPVAFLAEHLLRGDGGDDIPNMLTCDTVFMEAGRSKSITKPVLETWMKYAGRTDEFFDDARNGVINETDLHKITRRVPLDEFERNYYRNKTLIDLSMMPDTLKADIDAAFDVPKERGLENARQWMMAARMRLLLSEIRDFSVHGLS